MKSNLTPKLLVSALALGSIASAQPSLPASWNSTLSSGTYVILAPQLTDSANVLSADQKKGILDALSRDSQGAIARRYPNAKFVTDPATPNVIKVTPSLTAPTALVPWGKVGTRLDVQLPDGNTVALVDSFSVMTLWQQSWNAANYAFDRLAKQMP